MHQLLSDPIKIFWGKKPFPALCPDSVGDPCQPGRREEEKPRISGVAVMESDDLNNLQDDGISRNWDQN